jgi:hypothetical protein
MSTSREVTVKAQSGIVTLGELRAFIAELERAGAADSTEIKGTVRFGSGIKTLTATAVRFGDSVPEKERRHYDPRAIVSEKGEGP